MGYAGQDASVEIRLSTDGHELAIIDLRGRRRHCEARLPARSRADLAAALGRMADVAQRLEFSDAPTKVPAHDGGRVDVAALPAEVAIYVFRPGAWMSRSVRLGPAAARRLAEQIERDGAN
jgi:hypothetical protein